MKNSVHILLIDDDKDEFFLTRSLLSDRSYSSGGNEPIGFQLDWVATYEAGLAAIQIKNYDAYLVDYHLGEKNGLELVQEAVAMGCTAPFILTDPREL
jgi:DNA-binding response OmpR family regulator